MVVIFSTQFLNRLGRWWVRGWGCSEIWLSVVGGRAWGSGGEAGRCLGACREAGGYGRQWPKSYAGLYHAHACRLISSFELILTKDIWGETPPQACLKVESAHFYLYHAQFHSTYRTWHDLDVQLSMAGEAGVAHQYHCWDRDSQINKTVTVRRTCSSCMPMARHCIWGMDRRIHLPRAYGKTLRTGNGQDYSPTTCLW